MKKVLGVLFALVMGVNAQNIYATFSVEAQSKANLAFTSGGTIDEINVDVGSVVKKGDVLATLENSDLRAALQSAKVALKFAKRDYERQLKVKSLVDKSRLDGYEFKYESAKAKLAYQQALLDKTILKAPFDSIVTAKLKEVGDAVPGIQPVTIFTLQSQNKRKLKLAIDQKYWKSLKRGLPFKYHVDGDKSEYNGVLSKVYPSANSSSRKLFAEVEAKGFPSGLFGDGYIIVPAK
jgi:membrane fusion protein (multidrug efflux system)